MSLKFFHIFFIAVSSACAFGFSAWLLLGDGASHSTVNVLSGIASALAGIGLIAYGIWFLHKFKRFSFM
ncbi:MAG: hypothetical protein HYY49_14645 [Ignavibacteriales bacterium]|nr:hypothetical protein [Ignavibacteriales bacterium]